MKHFALRRLHIALTLSHRRIGPIEDLSVAPNAADIALSHGFGFAF
jgi:hypothetical protein